MTALRDRFWAKVAFKEFIRHFRKLSPEQIVSDVMASMDALEDLDDEGDSFGSKMVRWSMERVEQYPMAQANGQKGGRPRKSITEDGGSANIYGDAATSDGADVSITFSDNFEARQSQARESRRTGADSLRSDCHSAPVRSLPMPSKEQLYDFARAESLDEADARDWYEMTVVDRDGNDREGNRITNWKAALKSFCRARAQRRNA